MSTVQEAVQTVQAKPYGASVLASACAKWWRGTWVLLVTLIVNGLIQALLLVSNPVPGTGVVMGLLALASFIVLLATASIITATALLTPAGHVSFKAAIAKARSHLGLFCLWAVIWTVVVSAGLLFYRWPGLIIAAATPFLVLAAADGRRNPIGANFRAIGSRFGRYVVTLILSGIILGILQLFTALDVFFIGGAVGVFIKWFVFGLVFSWLVVGWALLYRATKVGQEPQPQAGTAAA